MEIKATVGEGKRIEIMERIRQVTPNAGRFDLLFFMGLNELVDEG
jgi:hypothetical protein